MKRKFLITFMVMLLCSATSFAQQCDYPRKTINGKEFYEYTIEAGEGVFSIAKKFGISQSEIKAANKGLNNSIRAGQIILIPIHDHIDHNTKEENRIHIVEAKQTVYGISKMYGISRDSLIAYNPGIEKGLKIGSKLIIPQKKAKESSITIQKDTVKSISHVVKPKETLYAISKLYNVAIHDLISSNPALEDGLKAGMTIVIPQKNDSLAMSHNNPTTNNTDTIKPNDTINIHKNDTILSTPAVTDTLTNNNAQANNVIVEDTIQKANTAEKIKLRKKLNIVYLLPLISEDGVSERSTERFIEFYRGSLIALNEAKQHGLSANIYTFSSGKSKEKIAELIQKLEKIDIDIIIGPAYSQQIDTIIAYAKARDIISIIPFSSKIPEQYYYPKLLQFNPPQDDLYNAILGDSFDFNRKFVIARFANCKNKGNAFADKLCEVLNQRNVEYEEVTINTTNVSSVIKSFNGSPALLVLATSSLTDAAPIINILKKHKLPKVKIWGFDEWGSNIINRCPNIEYYSLFNPKATDDYIELYQSWFGAYNRFGTNKYDLMGYDLTVFTMCNIILLNKDLSFNAEKEIEFMQSEPKLQLIDNRWVNTSYYIFNNENATLKHIAE